MIFIRFSQFKQMSNRDTLNSSGDTKSFAASASLFFNLFKISDIDNIPRIWSSINIYMVTELTWKKIHYVWKNYLWPNRSSPIEPTSAMCYLNGYDMANMQSTPTFFGYMINGFIVGVNSGHACPNQNNYRSRGLWVDPDYRGQGIGQQLLLATIEQGRKEGYSQIWSYPRQSSWTTYHAVGFELASNWESCETSEANAYCLYSVLS